MSAPSAAVGRAEGSMVVDSPQKMAPAGAAGAPGVTAGATITATSSALSAATGSESEASGAGASGAAVVAATVKSSSTEATTAAARGSASASAPSPAQTLGLASAGGGATSRSSSASASDRAGNGGSEAEAGKGGVSGVDSGTGAIGGGGEGSGGGGGAMSRRSGSGDQGGENGESGAADEGSRPGIGWRVKLYQLNDDGQWDDQGTGHISCRFAESLGGTALIVLAEDDGRELMQSKVVDEDVYQRQGDNIITWCEAPPLTGSPNGAGSGGGVDLALSFQENTGCLQIWDQICEVQGRFGNDYGRGGRGEAAVPLPEPKLDNLGDILELLKIASLQAKETYAASLSDKNGEYMSKLLKVFNDSEDLEDEESLRLLCHIFKAIVGLNDATLLEVLLADDLFVDMAGVFEYDSELKEKGEHRKFLTEKASFKQVLPIPDEDVVHKIRQNFRVMFLKDALLRPMMDDAVVGTLNSLTFFNNGEILQNLQHTDYLRDVFLLLNEPETRKGGQKREDILSFLRELFNMAKTLQVAPRDAFYRHLWEEAPLFEVFVPVLKDSRATVVERTASMEVLLASLSHDPNLFRMHVRKQGGHPPPPPTVNSQGKGAIGAGTVREVIGFSETSTGAGSAAEATTGGSSRAGQGASSVSDCGALLFWVIRRLTTDEDTGVLLQAAEICRMALDTETMEAQPERDTFLGVFYEHYVHWLVEPFWLGDLAEGTSTGGGSKGKALSSGFPGASEAGRERGGEGAATALGEGEGLAGGARAETLKASRGHICDLLSFCVRSHTYRMKYFVLRNNVVSRVLRMLSCREKYLQLSAVRFFRSCVGIKDDFYNRYLVKNNLFAPIFALFRDNRGRDNLINSAIIELVEFIRTENVKSLVEHIVERFSSSFVEVSQMATLESIKLKHEQNVDLRENRDRDFSQDGGGGGGGGVGGVRNSRAAQNRQRMVEEDGDEAYFNGDDDDEEQGVAVPTVGPHQANGGVAGGALKLVAYGDDDDSDEDLESPGREGQHTYEKGQEEHGASSSSVTPMVVAESGSERGSASTPERVAGDGEGVSGEGPRERRAGESPSSVNGIVSEATSPAETSSGSTEGGGEGDENADGSDGGEAKDDAPSDLSRGGPSGGDPDPKRLRRST